MPIYVGSAMDILTTVANQTANRALSTSYQNTNPTIMTVEVTLTAGSASLANISMGASSSNMTITRQQTIPASSVGSMHIAVPHGWWYSVTANASPTITYWTETS